MSEHVVYINGSFTELFDIILRLSSENNFSETQNEDNNFTDIINVSKPANPIMASLNNRLKSFYTWPVAIKQTKEQMAEAGFYYTGLSDKVMCFHCNGGLDEWYPEDDPWKQHAYFFKRCQYVLAIKGENYVKKINNEQIVEIENKNEIEENVEECKDDRLDKTESNNLCVICLENPKNMCILPCKHISMCGKCMCILPNHNCPICRNPFDKAVEVYLS
nr:alk-exo [Darna trima granulovirus]